MKLAQTIHQWQRPFIVLLAVTAMVACGKKSDDSGVALTPQEKQQMQQQSKQGEVANKRIDELQKSVQQQQDEMRQALKQSQETERQLRELTAKLEEDAKVRAERRKNASVTMDEDTHEYFQEMRAQFEQKVQQANQERAKINEKMHSISAALEELQAYAEQLEKKALIAEKKVAEEKEEVAEEMEEAAEDALEMAEEMEEEAEEKAEEIAEQIGEDGEEMAEMQKTAEAIEENLEQHKEYLVEKFAKTGVGSTLAALPQDQPMYFTVNVFDEINASYLSKVRDRLKQIKEESQNPVYFSLKPEPNEVKARLEVLNTPWPVTWKGFNPQWNFQWSLNHVKKVGQKTVTSDDVEINDQLVVYTTAGRLNEFSRFIYSLNQEYEDADSDLIVVARPIREVMVDAEMTIVLKNSPDDKAYHAAKWDIGRMRLNLNEATNINIFDQQSLILGSQAAEKASSRYCDTLTVDCWQTLAKMGFLDYRMVTMPDYSDGEDLKGTTRHIVQVLLTDSTNRIRSSWARNSARAQKRAGDQDRKGKIPVESSNGEHDYSYVRTDKPVIEDIIVTFTISQFVPRPEKFRDEDQTYTSRGVFERSEEFYLAEIPGVTDEPYKIHIPTDKVNNSTDRANYYEEVITSALSI